MPENVTRWVDRPKWQATADVQDAIDNATDQANVLRMALNTSDTDHLEQDIQSLHAAAYNLWGLLNRLKQKCSEAAEAKRGKAA